MTGCSREASIRPSRIRWFGAAVDGTFTTRTQDGAVTIGGLNQLVTTRGAAYLFFPARTALERLARGAIVPAAVVAPVTNPPIAPPAQAAPALPLRRTLPSTRSDSSSTRYSPTCRPAAVPRRASEASRRSVRAEFHVLGIDEVDGRSGRNGKPSVRVCSVPRARTRPISASRTAALPGSLLTSPRTSVAWQSSCSM